MTSPYGQVLKMIRENEPRAISLGYEVDKYKLLAFVLSAGLAGLADKVGAWVTVIIGAIFVICVLAFRRGVVGELHAFLDRQRARA